MWEMRNKEDSKMIFIGDLVGNSAINERGLQEKELIWDSDRRR